MADESLLQKAQGIYCAEILPYMATAVLKIKVRFLDREKRIKKLIGSKGCTYNHPIKTASPQVSERLVARLHPQC